MDIKDRVKRELVFPADWFQGWLDDETTFYDAVITQIVKIATQMCEEQKKQAYHESYVRAFDGYNIVDEGDTLFDDEGISYYVAKESILNCKNVCQV